MNIKNIFGIKFPAKIKTDESLRCTIWLWDEIALSAKARGYSWASQAYYQERLNKSHDTIKRQLGLLIGAGLLYKIERRGPNGVNMYMPVLSFCGMLKYFGKHQEAMQVATQAGLIEGQTGIFSGLPHPRNFTDEEFKEFQDAWKKSQGNLEKIIPKGKKAHTAPRRKKPGEQEVDSQAVVGEGVPVKTVHKSEIGASGIKSEMMVSYQLNSKYGRSFKEILQEAGPDLARVQQEWRCEEYIDMLWIYEGLRDCYNSPDNQRAFSRLMPEDKRELSKVMVAYATFSHLEDGNKYGYSFANILNRNKMLWKTMQPEKLEKQLGAKAKRKMQHLSSNSQPSLTIAFWMNKGLNEQDAAIKVQEHAKLLSTI